MAVMLNVDMYTDTPCKIIGAICVALRLFCHLRYLNHHHHHFHHHLYHPQASGSHRASRHDEAGHPSQEPLAREGGDRGDGGGRQAHQLKSKCHD